MVIFNIVEQANVSRPYKLSNLIPNTMYTVEVFAGNSEGFGDPANASFHTNEDGKDYVSFVMHLVIYYSILLHTGDMI